MKPEVLSVDRAETGLRSILEVYRSRPYSQLEAYSYYGADNDEAAIAAREKSINDFLAGKIRNPTLVCPELSKPATIAYLAKAETEILGLMHNTVTLDFDSDREIALYDILRNRYLEIRMLQASQQLQDNKNLTTEEKEDLVTDFNVANHEVYGYINPKKFNILAGRLHADAQEIIGVQDAPEVVREAAEYLLANCESEAIGEALIEPSALTLSSLKQLVLNRNQDIVSYFPDRDPGEKLSINELLVDMQAVLLSRGTGWIAREEEGKSNVDTRQEDKTIYVGSLRTLPTRDEAIGLSFHEIDTHVERRLQGDQLDDPMLNGLGLAGSTDAEEGIATAKQKIHAGKYKTSGQHYVLAIGWADGVDGTKRDFRDVYELEWRRRILELYKEGKPVDAATIAKAQKGSANVTCKRVFRGTPCDVPGMVFTKDQSYLMGDQKIWEKLIQIAELPDDEKRREFDLMHVGKHDPTNPLHVRVRDAAIARKNQA